MLDICLLGTGGMMPMPERFLTACLFRLNGKLLLIDCGEGTQVTMKILGWGFKKIDCICITHFHADHISGLPGLLLTIGNAGRTEPLTIIGPVGIKNVVKSLCVIAKELPFFIIFTELLDDTKGIKVSDFVIDSIYLNHKIDCIGYKINVERMGRFDVNKALELDIPQNLWSKLQKNEEVLVSDKVITANMVMGESRKGISVAYITDTRPTENMQIFLKEVDLYIGEGIYADDDKLNKAREYKHMTFSEAANLAFVAKVKELWLTHFSPSLVDPELYINEATSIFCNSHVGFDRKTTTIYFEDL